MYCTACGQFNQQGARYCSGCGTLMHGMSPAPQQGESSIDDSLVGILPVNTSMWAIAAGYLGLFSLLMFPGPLALGCGIMALLHLRKHPRMRGHVRAWIGIVLGLLGTAMLGLMALSFLVTR